jgi:KipI family sensor histidine kinase inhibitor
VTSRIRAAPLGDCAITVTYGTERSAELLEQIHSAARTLAAAKLPNVEDIVPAYLALTVFYDALHTSYAEMSARIIDACERAAASSSRASESYVHRIPVRYDGPDLEEVAKATGLTVDDVIGRHSGRSYTVDLLGFVPGFAYLGEIDPTLRLPRRAQPRPRVIAGSVAIAGAQTAVYPLDTPGGWHIIGRTDVTMFDPARDPPALLRAGDTVLFERLA